VDTRSPCATLWRMEYIFGALILCALGFLIFKQFRTTGGGVDREIGKLQTQLEDVRKEKDELAGKGKELFSRFKDQESEYKVKLRECDDLRDQLRKYKESEERRRLEHDEKLQRLDRAEKSFEEEKMRVRREDEERQKKILEERDRMWNDHEQTVVAYLADLCSKPEYAFQAFDNTNLPGEFDGSFKPDFLIEFLGQYIIFDAKISRSENFQNYISDQVKKTVKKAKEVDMFYSSIFLVVPTDAICMLKSTVYYEQPYTFYVVSPEALAPILSSLKKITAYELADQFDPQERENIVSLIAKFDSHINARNTFDVIFAQMGAEVLSDARKINPEIAREVELRKQKIRIPTFKTSEVKKLIGSADARQDTISDLVSPKASIEKSRVEDVKMSLLADD